MTGCGSRRSESELGAEGEVLDEYFCEFSREE